MKNNVFLSDIKSIEDRPNFLDYSKAIGIYIVVFGHYTWYLNIPFSNSVLWNNTYNVTLFHMPLFFIISGILHKEMDSIQRSLKKNMKTLLMPYLLINLICLFVIILKNCFSIGFDIDLVKLSVKYFWGIVTAGDLYRYSGKIPAGPLWFVYSLFCIKTVFDIITFFVKKCKWGGGKCLIISVFIFAIWVIAYNGNIFPFRIDSSFIGFFFFLFGFLFRSHILQMLYSNHYRLLMTFAISCLITYFCGCMNIDYDSQSKHLSINICQFGQFPIVFFIGAISGTISIFSLSRIIDKYKFKMINNISNGTIIILGFHQLIFSSLQGRIVSDNFFTALLVSLIIVLFCYWLILFASRYCPILLGGRRLS
jgi:fucose 4-O-acetylase-like acetyltransferase